MSVVPPNKAIRFPPSTTTATSLLFSSANSKGETANTNIMVYATIPSADNGISMAPKCNDAYGPCNTTLHDEEPALSEHNAPINDEDVFEDVYCILSYVR